MARKDSHASAHVGRGSWQRVTARTHLLVSAAVGLLAGGVTALAYGTTTGALVFWVTAAAVFLIWTWSSIWQMDATGTAEVAQREDPSRAARDLVLLLLAVGSMLTVGVVIFRPNDSGPVRLVLGVLCVAASWAVLHTIFSLRYARLFYSDPVGGIDFTQEPDPTYRDFAYVGFTVGMTFQVSDTDIGKDTIRTAVLRHALLSFMFGAVILAITINLLAGLGG